MSPRWQTIERLFHAALERPASQRPHFVREEAGDEQLAAEVLELVEAAEPLEDLPARPLSLHGLMDAFGSALLSGQQLGHYVIGELVGEGGMGLVYRAIDERDGSTVAIKILPPGQAQHPRRLARFQQEARALAALHHPAIVRIREAGVGHSGSEFQPGSEHGVHYLVMEYLEGETLRQRVLRAGPLPATETIECGLAISAALEVAHQAGVIHRDLKPENVMLNLAGLKVFDFGLAHLDERDSPQRTTLEGALAGTIAYLAPEQIEGSPGTPQSDIFALGVLLYEAVTGQAPFQRANPIATARAILREQPDYRPVPLTLRPVLQRCLAKSNRRRYQSASQVHSDLEKIRSGIRVSHPHRMARVAAGVVAVLVVLTAVWWQAQSPVRPDPRAIQSFQLGKYHWSRRTPESIHKSVEYFRQASAIDPRFAPAYGWLADSLAMLPEYDGAPDDRNTEAARQAAQRAIQLDPRLYIAHLALGWIFFSYDRHWAAAEPEFRKAVALAPAEALPHQRYGLALITRGRFMEAETELLRAQQLDPLAMLPMINLAELWFYAHRFDLEEAELRKILERDPGSVLARAMLAKMETVSGRSKDAIAEMQHLLAMPETANWCPQLAEAYARDGQSQVALQQLATCGSDSAPQPSLFLYLGQPGRAIAMLQQRYDTRDTYAAYLNVDPTYDSLRNQPDFRRLLNQMEF